MTTAILIFAAGIAWITLGAAVAVLVGVMIHFGLGLGPAETED